MLDILDKVGNYLIEGKVGGGAVGTVYRARHEVLDTEHAVKLLKIDDAELRDRLFAEGRTQARLDHANLVRVTDVLDIDGRPALIMDFVHGPTLAELLRKVRPTLSEVERIFREIVQGVAAAHRAEVVHRDLKPSNILLDRRHHPPRPRVADFGVARALDAARGTSTGKVLGTPGYMAPEQLLGIAEIGPAADVFSLGVILAELLTGELPYPYRNPVDWLEAVRGQQWNPPQDCPPGLARVAVACLRSNPQDRPADGSVVLRLLEGSERPREPREAKRAVSDARGWQLGALSLSAIGLGLLSGALFSVWALSSPPVPPPAAHETDQLFARAWRLADRRPGESLALLRAASALSGEPLPKDLLAQLLSHGAQAYVLPMPGPAVGVDQRGDWVAGVTDQGLVQVWSITTGERVAEVSTAMVQPRELRLLDDGALFTLRPHPTMGRAASDVMVWRLPNGDALLRDGNREPAPILPIDEDFLVPARQQGQTAVKRVKRSGEVSWTLPLRGKAWGEWWLSASRFALHVEGRVMVADAETGTELVDLDLGVHSSNVVLDPSGEVLAIGATDALRLYRLEEGSARVIDPDFRYAQVIASGEGEHFAALDWQRARLRIYDWYGELVRSFVDRDRGFSAVAFQGAETIVTGSRDGLVRWFSIHNEEPFAGAAGHRAYVTELSTGSERLASASLDATVRLWPKPSAALGAEGRKEARGFPREGQTYGLDDGLVRVLGQRVWHWSALRDTLDVLEVPLPDPLSYGGGAGGSALVVKGLSDRTWVWSRRAGATEFSTRLGLSRAAVSPDGAFVGEAGKSWMGLWSIDGRELVGGAVHGSEPRISWISTPDGPFFLIGHGEVGRVDVWTPDPPSRHRVLQHGLRGQRGMARIAGSADGRYVIAGLYGGGVVVWAIDGGEPIELAVLQDDPVLVAVHGEIAVAVTRRGTAVLWDVPTRQELGRLELERVPMSLHLDAFGVVIGDVSGGISWWKPGSPRVERRAHRGPVRLLVPDPDTGRLWSIGDQAVAWSWPRDMASREALDLESTGRLTNLRVCSKTWQVVPVVPWPNPESVWAPSSSCIGEG